MAGLTLRSNYFLHFNYMFYERLPNLTIRCGICTSIVPTQNHSKSDCGSVMHIGVPWLRILICPRALWQLVTKQSFLEGADLSGFPGTWTLPSRSPVGAWEMLRHWALMINLAISKTRQPCFSMVVWIHPQRKHNRIGIATRMLGCAKGCLSRNGKII